MEYNICLDSDIYKNCHWKMYPKGMTKNYAYLTARKSPVINFGLQYYLKKYLTGNVVTREKIDEAKTFFDNNVGEGVFNIDGWNSLLENYGGKLPVQICAKKENNLMDKGEPILTIENTDDRFAWLSSYLETLLVNLWYPCSVATNVFEMQKILSEYDALSSCNNNWLKTALSNSGMRSASSPESGALASAAHLLFFNCTTAPAGIRLLQEYYGSTQKYNLVSVAEHSVITSYKPEGEFEAYSNCIDTNPNVGITIPVDSYNIWTALKKYFGEGLKNKIIKRQGKTYARPDSGDVCDVLVKTLDILSDKFGYYINKKGYVVLENIGVIQGDGISKNTLNDICKAVTSKNFSIENVNFGCGGAMVHSDISRDTFGFAQKTSWVQVNSIGYGVRKQPITDSGKNSLSGRFTGYDLNPIFLNGEIVKEIKIH